MFIEFKWVHHDNPFKLEDWNNPFVWRTKRSIDTLGQIMAYAAAQFGSQFRTHIYSILIVKSQARIIRWDRSGAIVTEAIKYNHSNLLAEFFCRYSAASREMCGFDESVSVPTSQEVAQARSVLRLPYAEPLIKIEVWSADQKQRWYYVAAAPLATAYTPPGRATRGFEANGITECQGVYLKDTWRLDLPEFTPEGDTYSWLMKGRVRNIPQCLIWGDILDMQYHATKTQSYVSTSWASTRDSVFLPHRHYHLVLDIIRRKLTSFCLSVEAIRGVRDALIGNISSLHYWDKANPLTLSAWRCSYCRSPPSQY